MNHSIQQNRKLRVMTVTIITSNATAINLIYEIYMSFRPNNV